MSDVPKYAIKSALGGNFTGVYIRPVSTITKDICGSISKFKINLVPELGLNDRYTNPNGILSHAQADKLGRIVQDTDAAFNDATKKISHEISKMYGARLASTDLSRTQVEYILGDNKVALDSFLSHREHTKTEDAIVELTKDLYHNIDRSLFTTSFAHRQIAQYLVKSGKLK